MKKEESLQDRGNEKNGSGIGIGIGDNIKKKRKKKWKSILLEIKVRLSKIKNQVNQFCLIKK